MPAPRDHLRLVSDPGPPPAGIPSADDIALVAILLAVGLVPVAFLVAGRGYGAGSAGAGTAIAVLSARELWGALRARLRARPRRA